MHLSHLLGGFFSLTFFFFCSSPPLPHRQRSSGQANSLPLTQVNPVWKTEPDMAGQLDGALVLDCMGPGVSLPTGTMQPCR